MKSFLSGYFSNLTDLQTEQLKGDGGHRSYTRLRKGNQTFILMSCGLKDPSLKSFVEIQKRLKPYVLVPQIFHLDLKKGFLLLEDLGDESLEYVFFKKAKNLCLSFYQKALSHLIDLQSQVQCLEKDPVFDARFFSDEVERAVCDIEKYLCDVLNHKSFCRELSQNFKRDLEQIVSYFQNEDYVYCHRDFHSRNLMVKDNREIMIDFQDAGKGPWYYDLASLLYDSYVFLSNRNELAIYYFKNLGPFLKKKVKSVKRVNQMVQLQFLQRGFTACGRFCAFKVEDNKDTHLQYLTPTLQLLKTNSSRT